MRLVRVCLLGVCLRHVSERQYCYLLYSWLQVLLYSFVSCLMGLLGWTPKTDFKVD